MNLINKRRMKKIIKNKIKIKIYIFRSLIKLKKQKKMDFTFY